MPGKLFNLKILTPERTFIDDNAEAVILSAPDGRISMLADHIPMMMPVEAGVISIKADGAYRDAICSEGFLEVHHQGILVFVQSCEWPEEIDLRRAEEARRRAEELLRQKQSNNEYKQNKLALARAMARLKFTSIK